MRRPTPLAAGVRPAAWLLVAIALVAAGGCGREEPARRQAILILLDAARPDRFSGYGYERETTPHLDELAEDGVVLHNHFAQYTFTRSSIPSLLYSRYFSVPVFPRDAKVMLSHPRNLTRVPDPESMSLPRALSAAGLHTALISAHSWFRAGTAIEREFDELHDLSSELEYPARYGAPRAEQVIDYAAAWLEDHLEEDYFLYLHLMDTHFPHFFEEDAEHFEPGLEPSTRLAERFATGGRLRLESRIEPLSARERAFLDAVYDGSLRYADRHLGRLIELLRERRSLRRTLIVVTSDHGEHLLESPGRFSHGGAWLDKVARVPMIVHYPERVAPGRLDAMTENVDVMPTVLGLLGVDLPAGKRVDGRDLTGAMSGEPFTREYAFGRSGVRSARYKAVFSQTPSELFGVEEPEAPLTGELYDLSSDPGELDDLWAGEPEWAAELLDVYRREMKAPFFRFWSSTTDEQPETSFVVAAAHFEPLDAVTEDPAMLTALEARTPAERRGWYQSRHRRMFALVAAPGAVPLTITFPVPDGLYSLSAAIRGSGRLELPGLEEPLELTAEPLPADTLVPYGDPVPAVELACGAIEVRGGVFEARLDPDSNDSLFAIRYFSFEPLRGDLEEAAAEDEELRERLRTLGYVD